MSRKDPIHFTLAALPILAFAAALSIFLVVGLKPMEGFCLGASVSYGSLLLDVVVVRFALSGKNSKFFAISTLQVLFLLKVPFFCLAVIAVNSMGRLPVLYFICGYPLVYFSLIVGAILSRFAPARYNEVPD